MLRVYICICFFCVFSFPVFSQNPDSLVVVSNAFNQGLILSLPQAIQGQVPGLMIARPGANPNGEFDMLYRGYNTFKNRMQPLLMLDGIPGVSWHLIDPFLVDSLGVRRGSQLVQMGMQAGAGVFDASIASPEKQGLSITLLQNVSIENYQRAYDNLNSDEFRRVAPSYSLIGDSNTDWLDALTQTAISTQTGLKLGYKDTNLNSRLILSHRNVNGIQPNTGFGQLSLYGGVDYSFLKGKIKVGGSSLMVNRDSDIGNTDFFHGAMAMNPTLALDAPIYHFTNYGGNPWIRMNLDENTLESRMNMIQGNVIAKPTAEWTIQGRIGQLSSRKNQLNYFGVNEASGDLGIFLERGRGSEDSRNFLELSTDYLLKNENFTLNPGVRFTSQRISYDFSGYTTSRVSEHDIGIQQNPADFGTYTLNALGFFLNTTLGDKLEMDFLIQSEGSSNLGKNSQWGNFFGMDLRYQIHSNFQLFGSYSQTGMIPDKSGLSRTLVQIEPEFHFSYFGNSDLKWEATNMWELGGSVQIFKEKLFGEFRYFNSKSSDFINLMRDFDLTTSSIYNTYSPHTYQNFGEISNRGTEWLLQLLPVKLGQLIYQSSVNATFLRSEWTDLKAKHVNLEGDNMTISNIGGNPYTQFNTLMMGEQIGTVRALNFSGIDRSTGQWILERNHLDENWRLDYVPQGQGVPKWWMGWNHQLKWKKWKSDLFLRGVFGHILVNESDLRYGNLKLGYDNALRSYEKTRAMGLTDYNSFSNFFIESSNFLSIHYFSISRDIDFIWGKHKINSTLSMIGNNLFYFTKYSGADPEPRIIGRQSWQADEHIEVSKFYFAPGIDAASTWLPSRAFSLAYQLRF